MPQILIATKHRTETVFSALPNSANFPPFIPQTPSHSIKITVNERFMMRLVGQAFLCVVSVLLLSLLVQAQQLPEFDHLKPPIPSSPEFHRPPLNQDGSVVKEVPSKQVPANLSPDDEFKRNSRGATDIGTDGPLTYGILAFASLVMIIEAIVVLKLTVVWTSFDILRMFGFTLIVFGSLILMSAGYSSTQVAPVFGLFGTALGYLLGKTKE
jgi:hypothetical protein